MAIAASVVVCVGVLVSVAVHTTPMADDYGWLSSIPHSTPSGFLQGYWNGLTDRYANALLLLVTVKGLGASALQVTSLLMLFLLCIFSAMSARRVVPVQHAGIGAALLGSLASVAIIVTAPSLFDTFGWYTAVTIYLSAVIAAAGVVAWMAHLAVSARKVGAPQTILSFVIGLIAAGFTEVMGLVIVATAMLAAANALAAAQRPVRRSLSVAYCAAAAGAAVGVGIIFLGPGSRLRAHSLGGSHFGVTEISRALTENFWYVHFVVSWRALPAFAAGLIYCWLRGPVADPATKSWLLIWTVYLMIAPRLIVALVTGISIAPVAFYRTAFIATACMTIAVAVLTYLFASAVVDERPSMSVAVVPAAAVAVVVGGAMFVASALPLIRAEELRATLVAARAVFISRQLHQHGHQIWIMPAPLLYPQTQAFDLGFGDIKQPGYVLPALRGYYGIPTSARVRVASAQPPGYCLSGVSVPWLGIRACE
ncbi:MAG: hypothetical protein ACLP8S_19315 [Solirubrobacteraceae bacterium]